MGSVLFGYGGKVAPPFARSFMGGENDVRGFDFFTITPIAYLPSSTSSSGGGGAAILNPDGSQRTQKTLVDGVLISTPVTQNIPFYQITTPGGDTTGVFNFEYRIPIFGPVTLAPFFDAGINRISFTNQLRVNPGEIASLNAQFPEAAFSDKVLIAPGTQVMRMSTGIEVQVVLPIVQAPFRVYWAYNPSVVRQNLEPPIVFDRTMFPNAASFTNAITSYSPVFPDYERRSVFRFTIGRTF
jgi:outer membrane protein insertion porin family